MSRCETNNVRLRRVMSDLEKLSARDLATVLSIPCDAAESMLASKAVKRNYRRIVADLLDVSDETVKSWLSDPHQTRFRGMPTSAIELLELKLGYHREAV